MSPLRIRVRVLGAFELDRPTLHWLTVPGHPADAQSKSQSYVYISISIYTCHICIYIYMATPHELPTLVLYRKYRIKQLFPQVRIPYLSKTAQNQTHISRESAR